MERATVIMARLNRLKASCVFYEHFLDELYPPSKMHSDDPAKKTGVKVYR